MSDPYKYLDALTVCGECASSLVRIGRERYCVEKGCPMFSKFAASRICKHCDGTVHASSFPVSIHCSFCQGKGTL